MSKLARYLFGEEPGLTIATRTIDGENWYMASDICRVLGINDMRIVVHREREWDRFTFEDHEWRKKNVYFRGYGKRYVLQVNDMGMLKLIDQVGTKVGREAQRRYRTIPAHLFPDRWGESLKKAV